MSIRRQAARRDDNERPIIEALRRAGASVEQLSKRGVPDLLVGWRGETFLIEVKTAKGRLTADESAWLESWRGQAVIVRSVEEALAVIGVKS